MFVLSLDVEPAIDDDDFVAVSLHGGHRSGTQEHRWYDKTCLIVDAEGRCSYNFEHSLYDGAAMRRLCDETWHMSKGLDTGREAWKYRWSERDFNDWSSTLTPLVFEMDSVTEQSVRRAADKHEHNQSSVKIVQGSFLDFGKNVLKTFCTSPDGVLQALYKLTYARIHGWTKNKGVYVYESCQTKSFLCGRTEVIRTATMVSNEFVDYMMQREMLGESVDVKIFQRLLRAAADKHAEVARLASKGQGVDRHLFSMFRLAGMAVKKPLPSIFTDPAWALSNASVLSTSNLTSEAFHGMGYGPVVPHGYGVAYGICQDALYFGISNFVAKEEKEEKKTGGGFGGVSVDSMEVSAIPTDSEKFRTELYAALRQARKIMSSD
jgi:carnitine O-acetyltransferase